MTERWELGDGNINTRALYGGCAWYSCCSLFLFEMYAGIDFVWGFSISLTLLWGCGMRTKKLHFSCCSMIYTLKLTHSRVINQHLTDKVWRGWCLSLRIFSSYCKSSSRVVESGGDEEQWKYVVCWVGKWRKRRHEKKRPSKSQKNVLKMDTKASKCALIFNFSEKKMK